MTVEAKIRSGQPVSLDAGGYSDRPGRPMDAGLKEELVRFHKQYRASYVTSEEMTVGLAFRVALGLRPRQMSILKREISKVVEPVRQENTSLANSWDVYDGDRLDAICAIAWSMKRLYPPNVTTADVNWSAIVEDARAALGDSEIKRHIKDIDEGKRQPQHAPAVAKVQRKKEGGAVTNGTPSSIKKVAEIPDKRKSRPLWQIYGVDPSGQKGV